MNPITSFSVPESIVKMAFNLRTLSGSKHWLVAPAITATEVEGNEQARLTLLSGLHWPDSEEELHALWGGRLAFDIDFMKKMGRLPDQALP